MIFNEKYIFRIKSFRNKEKNKIFYIYFFIFFEKNEKNIIPTFCGNVMVAFFDKKNILNN